MPGVFIHQAIVFNFDSRYIQSAFATSNWLSITGMRISSSSVMQADDHTGDTFSSAILQKKPKLVIQYESYQIRARKVNLLLLRRKTHATKRSFWHSKLMARSKVDRCCKDEGGFCLCRRIWEQPHQLCVRKLELWKEAKPTYEWIEPD